MIFNAVFNKKVIFYNNYFKSWMIFISLRIKKKFRQALYENYINISIRIM